jgi:hypothetical protein
MRVKMILPALTEAKSPFWHPIKYSLFPPLGLATLAGYLDAGDEVPMQDEHVERLDLEDTPDLVVIQVYITSAYRAYRIADHYRRRGAHVALRRLSARLSRSGLPITNANAGVDAADPARSEGFETLDRANLMEQRKYQNLRRDYAAAIHRLHGLGVMIYGSLVFGMNADDSSVFARTVQWAIEFHGCTSPGIWTVVRFRRARPSPRTGGVCRRNWRRRAGRHPACRRWLAGAAGCPI